MTFIEASAPHRCFEDPFCTALTRDGDGVVSDNYEDAQPSSLVAVCCTKLTMIHGHGRII